MVLRLPDICNAFLNVSIFGDGAEVLLFDVNDFSPAVLWLCSEVGRLLPLMYIIILCSSDVAAAALGPEINTEIMKTKGNTEDKLLRGVGNDQSTTLF
jgi:hypothetical protein